MVFGLTTVKRATRTRDQLEGINQQRSVLEKFGTYVDVGIQGALDQDQLEQAQDYIMSPFTHIFDKVEMANKLILYNMRKGHGRVDQFWSYVFNAWMKLYGVWVVSRRQAEKYSIDKVIVQYDFSVTDSKGNLESKQRQEMIETMTLSYLMLNPEKFQNVKVLRRVRHTAVSPRFRSPLADLNTYVETVKDFGAEVMIPYAYRVLNYINHPDHVLPKTVLVIQTAGGQQGNWQGGVAGASDFTGGRSPPPNSSVPPKVR